MTSPSPAGADLVALAQYLDGVLEGGLRGPLNADLIAGGRSNLTYFLTDGHTRWVLRRPPLGHVLDRAHDMGREARVMSALAATPVPVPRIVTTCADPDVLGAPFFVMEHVDGRVLRTDSDFKTLSPADAQHVAEDFIDVLAALHQLRPADVGLTDFGRPEGFAARQVRLWARQRESSWVRDVPGMTELGAALAEKVPSPATASVIHGDYRLDNMVLNLADQRVAAVLDWELATVGDPLMDLGLAYVYWIGWAGLDGNVVGGTPGMIPGFFNGQEFVDRYRTVTGFGVEQFDWYVAFAFFKVAVLLEGIHCRYTQGLTVGEGFAEIGQMVPKLVERGRDALSGSLFANRA
ncbi:phosphotransferase family protein [Rhodococcus opacus]|uniref:phosphotransferase family protein n=1 Tax=Rhodococcus opacus TaxID=37919 RepID=UPI0022367BB7|nr:phosphotransferase family protein [Rhodococcus opacus]UZG59943.1 phosphotransferase family protein [Rhodococcus opacus]